MQNLALNKTKTVTYCNSHVTQNSNLLKTTNKFLTELNNLSWIHISVNVSNKYVLRIRLKLQ